MNKKKKKFVIADNTHGGIVYSTNPGTMESILREALEKVDEKSTVQSKNSIKMRVEKSGRGGKTVTILYDFVLTHESPEELCQRLKKTLGTGGNISDGVILIQGDVRWKIRNILENEGFSVKGG